MKTIPNKGLLSRENKMIQILERDAREHFEKFKQETQELLRQRREAKEQKVKEAEKLPEQALASAGN